MRTMTVLIFALFSQLVLGPLPGYCQETREDAEAYYKLGQAYYDQGKFKEAEEFFQKAVNILNSIPEKKGPAVKAPEKKTEAAKPSPSRTPRKEYVIGDDDVLHISVWQNPDLETQANVRPDGMISVPLAGDIAASGLTIRQLTEEVTAALSEYVREPQVSIAISKIGGRRVIVLGQVAQPGVINAGGAMRVMDAVGMAGGFTRDAVPSSTVIIRGGFAGAKAQKLNLSKVFKGDLNDNISLQSQDIIFVPRKFISDMNYFLNQVLEPLSRGAYVHETLQDW